MPFDYSGGNRSKKIQTLLWNFRYIFICHRAVASSSLMLVRCTQDRNKKISKFKFEEHKCFNSTYLYMANQLSFRPQDAIFMYNCSREIFLHLRFSAIKHASNWSLWPITLIHHNTILSFHWIFWDITLPLEKFSLSFEENKRENRTSAVVHQDYC